MKEKEKKHEKKVNTDAIEEECDEKKVGLL